MSRKLILLVFAAVLIGGCGENGGEDAASAGPLEECSHSGSGLSASDWSGSVSGISCHEAGQFIQDHALADFPQPPNTSTYAAIKRGEPGSFKSEGFDCRYRPLSDGSGWHIRCARGTEVAAFYFTP